ncbi:MAG: Quinolinate synthetase, partial [uncultured Solirubrobacteraceae bacterium]
EPAHPRVRPCPPGGDPRARPRARRGHPGPQLPGARGAGRGRLRRRLPPALAARGALGGERDRVLRRALHGRDGVDPLPGEDRPAPGRGRGLLAGGLDHRGAAACLEGAAPGRRRGDVRQHERRGQGGDGLLRHVLQRRGGRRVDLSRARPRHGDPLRARHVPGRLRREDDGPPDARVGRGVPRPRGHPPPRHRRHARRAPGRRLPHPPRVRLLDLGHGVRGGRRRERRRRPHALHGRDDDLRARGGARLDGDRRDGDRDAAPAADGGARRRLRRRQRGGELPLHEDDHAAEAARRAARRRAGRQGARRDRRACPAADRAHGRDRL